MNAVKAVGHYLLMMLLMFATALTACIIIGVILDPDL